MNNQQDNFELPPVAPGVTGGEVTATSQESREGLLRTNDQAAQGSSVPMSAPVMPTAPIAPPLIATPAPAPTLLPTAPQIADDADLIEKEWVDKAKEIVEQTRDDPYRQNQGVNTLKADYIQKRYNKQIKTGEVPQ